MFTWFATIRGKSEMAEGELAAVHALLAGTPGLAKALVYTPASTSDPYLDDGRPPTLVLQLYFREIADMEAALAADGHLQMLVRLAPGADAVQQGFVARSFPVPDANFRTPPGEYPGTYLVSYEGTADDLNVWLNHYIQHHPPIMARFPGIREIEIYTRLDWCGFLPWPRTEHMQRNKVVFDSPAALTAALNSPVRHEMRADFRNFPKFTGANTHFPMRTRMVTRLGARK